MIESIRAKYEDGVLKPSERLEVEDGAEVVVSVSVPRITADDVEASKSTAGVWKGKFDADQIIREIYEDRLTGTQTMRGLKTE